MFVAGLDGPPAIFDVIDVPKCNYNTREEKERKRWNLSMENRTVDLFDHLRKLALLQNETISGWSILASASQYIKLGESDYRKWKQKHHNDESSVMTFYMRQSSIELFWCKCCEKLVKINDDHCPLCGLVI